MSSNKLEKDTQLTTASGCTFTVEKGWFVTQKDDVIVLEVPEHDLTVTLLENTEATVEQAVLTSWKKIQPDFSPSIKHTIKGVPQDGWDEIVQCMYEASTKDNHFIFAIARRVGKTWYIMLINGTEAAFERRMAGWLLIDTSFKVPGMQKESFACKKAHILDDVKLQEFMSFVEDARVRCRVPGAAVGIVQNGKVILKQGLGVLMLGKKEKVTSQTLFMIGSTTKALTTFMMACLVDEGKFTWDTSVTQLMPNFALGDETMTKQALMRHMVSASTGMPRQDIDSLFNYDQATPESRLNEMRTMKPSTGFGETFQYSNEMVSAGGYIAAHGAIPTMKLGHAYDAVMQSRVFDPIGMNSTTFDFNIVKKVNHSVPHGLDLQGDVVPLDVEEEKWVESKRPAGGAWSNIDDMTQYIITELNNGINSRGVRIIEEKNLLKRREPQVKVTDKISYGLGMMIENDHGILSVGHGGVTAGFTSELFFLPEYNIGLVMLTNVRAAMTFAQAVKRKFMEILFDGKKQADEMVKIGVEQQKKIFEKMCESVNFKPANAWIKQFVGTYSHSTLGQLIIQETADGAELDARIWKSALGQKKEQDGTEKLVLINAPFAGFEFLPQKQDGSTQLLLEIGQHKYIFEKN